MWLSPSCVPSCACFCGWRKRGSLPSCLSETFQHRQLAASQLKPFKGLKGFEKGGRMRGRRGGGLKNGSSGPNPNLRGGGLELGSGQPQP